MAAITTHPNKTLERLFQTCYLWNFAYAGGDYYYSQGSSSSFLKTRERNNKLGLLYFCPYAFPMKNKVWSVGYRQVIRLFLGLMLTNRTGEKYTQCHTRMRILIVISYMLMKLDAKTWYLLDSSFYTEFTPLNKLAVADAVWTRLPVDGLNMTLA